MFQKISKHFAPSITMTLLALFGICLFTSLGIWQIKRSHVKRNILNLERKLQDSKPVAWQGEIAKFPQFMPLETQGVFLQTTFLLDNQHHEHKFGYNVYSPLLLKNDKVVLVDRGFVNADISRKSFPEILTPLNEIHIKGHTYLPSKNFVLGNIIDRKIDNMYLVESIDFNVISHLLQKDVYPFIIRLGKDEPFGYLREWKIVSMPPERHLGYAFQWFSLALCILIIFITLNFKYEKKQ